MPHNHAVSPTTHTVEMTQIAELNDHLAMRGSTEAISAADLDLTGVAVMSGDKAARNGLPAQAVLERVCCDGPPEFPYIHAHFRRDPSEPGVVTVDMHTHALRELSRRLHLREVWGVGSADDVGGPGQCPAADCCGTFDSVPQTFGTGPSRRRMVVLTPRPSDGM